MIKKKKSQSTLEYIVALLVIIAIIAIATFASLRPAVNRSIDHVSDQMEAAVKTIKLADTSSRAVFGIGIGEVGNAAISESGNLSKAGN